MDNLTNAMGATMLNNRFLSEVEILDMAETGFNTFMMTASNHSTIRAIREHSLDKFGVKANETAVFAAYQKAKCMAENARIAVKKSIAEGK